MYKKFKWFIKYYKKYYIIGVIFLLLSDIVSLFLPYIIGKLIDLIYNNSIDLNNFIKINISYQRKQRVNLFKLYIYSKII